MNHYTAFWYERRHGFANSDFNRRDVDQAQPANMIQNDTLLLMDSINQLQSKLDDGKRENKKSQSRLRHTQAKLQKQRELQNKHKKKEKAHLFKTIHDLKKQNEGLVLQLEEAQSQKQKAINAHHRAQSFVSRQAVFRTKTKLDRNMFGTQSKGIMTCVRAFRDASTQHEHISSKNPKPTITIDVESALKTNNTDTPKRNVHMSSSQLPLSSEGNEEKVTSSLQCQVRDRTDGSDGTMTSGVMANQVKSMTHDLERRTQIGMTGQLGRDSCLEDALLEMTRLWEMRTPAMQKQLDLLAA